MAAGIMRKDRGGGRRPSRRGRHTAMAEINVTPFVDVMLVLLIIFMVAAPLLTVGVPLELPKTAAQAVPTEPEEPLAISLTADGQITLMTTPVPERELIDKLRAIAAERVSDRIYLRADGAISYNRVVQVMGALNAAGFTNITLVTETGGPAMTANGI